MHSEEMKYDVDNLKNFGFRGETTVVAPGINSKMDEMRAAYGLLNLRQVDAAIAARRHVAEQYVAALKDVKGIRLFPYEMEQVSPSSSPSSFSSSSASSSAFSSASSFSFNWNFAYFPILVDDSFCGNTEGALSARDALYEKMKSQGVLARRYFYPLITDFEPYKHLPSASIPSPLTEGIERGHLPIARRIADQVICLPMHHALTDDDVRRVLNCIIG